MPRKKKSETEDVLEAEKETAEAVEESVEPVEKDASKKDTKEVSVEKAEKPSKSKKSKVEKQTLSDKEFEKKVLELAKQGLTSEKIGEQLRKQGIHPKEHLKDKRKISTILKENNVYVNPDLKNVTEQFNRLKTHFGKNKQDKRAKRDVVRVQSHLRKLNTMFGIKVSK